MLLKLIMSPCAMIKCTSWFDDVGVVLGLLQLISLGSKVNLFHCFLICYSIILCFTVSPEHWHLACFVFVTVWCVICNLHDSFGGPYSKVRSVVFTCSAAASEVTPGSSLMSFCPRLKEIHIYSYNAVGILWTEANLRSSRCATNLSL